MPESVALEKHRILNATQGWRDARDIISAAVEQGWRYRTAGSSHLRLIPPDPEGTPVGISGTPSDVHYRRQIIRLMRRSGFIWPWPPVPASEDPTAPVPEVWEPVPLCSVAEVSNGGRVRKTIGHKPIEPDSRNRIVLTGDDGIVHSFLVPVLVRALFDHPPLPHVVPVPEPSPENQEVTMTPPDTERWEPVLIEGIVEGYEVNPLAQVRAPKSTKFKNRTILTPNMVAGRLAVNLRTTAGKYVRHWLDEIVLEAFQIRPSAQHLPRHIDGSAENCTLENLTWETLPVAEVTETTPEQPAAPAPTGGIQELELTVATHNILARVGIRTISELVALSERELWRLPRMGSRAIDEIKAKLAQRQLSLAEATDEEPTAAPKARVEVEGVPHLQTGVEQVAQATEPEAEVESEPQVEVEPEPVASPIPQPQEVAVSVDSLSEVVVHRIYVNPATGLQVQVDDQGHVHPPEGELTLDQMVALGAIAKVISDERARS